MPEITVLMPTYNCEKYIDRAINSILTQTFEDFEFLIIDDASSDKTSFKILQYRDHRIRFLSKERNTGLVESLNMGVSMAKGKYIARMDGDDISLPDRLLRQHQFLEENRYISVCGSWVEYVDEEGKSLKALKYAINDSDIKVESLSYCPIVHPSVFMRKEIFDKTNIYYDSHYLHSEDYALWVKLMKNDVKFANIPQVLLQYRFHSKQVSKIFKNNQIEMQEEISVEHLMGTGIRLSPELKDLHIRFVYHKMEGEIKELRQLKRWLAFFVKENIKTSYFDPISLKGFIRFHLEENIKLMGYYRPYLLLLLFSQFKVHQLIRKKNLLKSMIKSCIFWRSPYRKLM